jgi:glycosyltransferase involved in cell wall biosynthesis
MPSHAKNWPLTVDTKAGTIWPLFFFQSIGTVMRPLRICLVITEDWYFWSHRRSLAQFLVAQGHDVHLVTRLSKLEDDIRATGIMPHQVGLQRSGKNPWNELQAIGRMAATFRKLRPDVVHLVGMKPILYGSMAAHLAGVPATVCAIAGLGWLFTTGGVIKTAARQLVTNYFRFALAGNARVQFLVQNTHHQDVLRAGGMARPEQISIISGAGVNTNRFRVQTEPAGEVRVLTHARMLWDKGIGDLAEAAKLLQAQNVPCQVHLVGDPDPANPASISLEQLQAWNDTNVVRWQGRRDDIPQLLGDSHIACLPSYHEGFPLSLVEAMACGRAVVTSDIPGCRDAVAHEHTGLLVEPGNPQQLAAALARLILDPPLRRRMGRHGRRDVLQRMSSEIVNRQTLACYVRLLKLDSEISVEKAA